MNKGWIGVDLDQTLAMYNGWAGETVIGPPVPLMVERVKQWRKLGMDVRIFTARAASPIAIPHIEAWCLEHLGEVLPITNQKDYQMVELWDDRAVAVQPNTGEAFSWRFIRI